MLFTKSMNELVEAMLRENEEREKAKKYWYEIPTAFWKHLANHVRNLHKQEHEEIERLKKENAELKKARELWFSRAEELKARCNDFYELMKSEY